MENICLTHGSRMYPQPYNNCIQEPDNSIGGNQDRLQEIIDAA